MRKPWFQRETRMCGGWGQAPTTTQTVLFSGEGALSSPAGVAPGAHTAGCFCPHQDPRGRLRPGRHGEDETDETRT